MKIGKNREQIGKENSEFECKMNPGKCNAILEAKGSGKKATYDGECAPARQRMARSEEDRIGSASKN
jgi:hypothetical protein